MNAFDGADFTRLLCELLRGGHNVRFQAKGHSMQPTIVDGEILIAEPVSALDLRRNQILLYVRDDRVIAHRIQEIQRDGAARSVPIFLARGDSNEAFDQPVEAAQVLGRIVAVEREGHRVPMTGWVAGLRHWIFRLVFRSQSGTALRMASRLGPHWCRQQSCRYLLRLIRCKT